MNVYTKWRKAPATDCVNGRTKGCCGMAVKQSVEILTSHWPDSVQSPQSNAGVIPFQSEIKFKNGIESMNIQNNINSESLRENDQNHGGVCGRTSECDWNALN